MQELSGHNALTRQRPPHTLRVENFSQGDPGLKFKLSLSRWHGFDSAPFPWKICCVQSVPPSFDKKCTAIVPQRTFATSATQNLQYTET